MSLIYVRKSTDAGETEAGEVTGQNPFPVEIRFRSDASEDNEEVNGGHALPVSLDGPVKTELYVTQLVRVPYGATSGALDAADAMGDPFFFSVPRKGRILGIRMIDQDDDTVAATIHIFNRPFTAAASDAAFTISAADSIGWVTSEVFDSGTDIGSAKGFNITDVNKDYETQNGILYCQLSTSGTPNFASANTMPLVQLLIFPLI
jgi:hypothetical protein